MAIDEDIQRICLYLEWVAKEAGGIILAAEPTSLVTTAKKNS